MPKSCLKAVIDSKGQRPAFPLVLVDDQDIAAICPLVHAAQAKAVMQVVANPFGGLPQPAVVVSEITPSGWMTFQAARRKGKP